MKRLTLLSLLLAGVLSTASAADHAQSAPKGDPAKGLAIGSTVCAACHAADGNSIGVPNPKLAGQHPEYLFKQMKNFKSADGNPPERSNPIMNGMIAAFDEDQLRDIAAYFGSQKQVGDPATKSPESIEAGKKIFRAGKTAKGLPACAGCHGPNGMGIPAQFPRLAGQHAEYVYAQLVNFQNGTRKNSPQMADIAARLSDHDMKAVADYIAGLR